MCSAVPHSSCLHTVNLTFLSHLRYSHIPLCNTAAAAAKSLQLCPTLCDPIDGSPPGFPSWDSPGKNTGVGCHFLLQCVKLKSESEVAQSCLILRDLMDFRLLHPWDFPGKSTGVGCHCLLHYVTLCCNYLFIHLPSSLDWIHQDKLTPTELSQRLAHHR